jgi:predicted permease
MSISTKPSTDIAAIAGLTVALLSMAAVVLLVASFNLANMLLARSGSRRKEFAIRLAIGGSRGRVVRQLMTEGLILALVGGAAGLAIAIWSTQLLVATLSRVAPVSFTFEAMPDWRILSAMIGYCTLSTVVFGLLPARRLAGTDPGLALKGNAGELVTGRRFRLGLPNLFVMGQLALSLVLISVAALFLRGATEAAKADPGFSLDRGIMVQMDPSLGGLTAARSREVYQLALDRLRARPDVAAASVASIIPFGDLEDDVDMQRAGAPIRRGDANAATDLVEDSTLTSIGAGYFDALGLTVRSGREFTEDEERASGPPRVAIIDLGLAERLFGTASAVGRQVQYAPRGEGEPIVMTVVGVAPGIRQNMFATSPEPHVYVPFGSAFVSGAILHVRTRATSAAAEQSMLPGIRQLIADIDARVPVLEAQTLASYRDRNLLLGVVRAGAATFTVFGVVALLMAAVGVYGVKAYVVSRRTREIGIRVALGATARRVVWIIVRDGLTASVVGLGVGLVLSALVGIAMRSLTYQGRAADAAVLTVALVVLTSSALLASWLPARRATKIEPLRAIRE